MKYYVILLKEGLRSQEFEVDNLEELYKKIDSGHYHILSTRGTQPIRITRENITEITDVTQMKKDELGRSLNHFIESMADPKVNADFELKKMTEDKIKSLTEQIKKIEVQ